MDLNLATLPALRNEKMETPKHPGSVERLVDRIAKYQDSPAPSAPYEIAMNLFKHCFVLPSAHFGLLGNPLNLSLADEWYHWCNCISSAPREEDIRKFISH